MISVPPDILDYPTSSDMVVREGSNVTLKCAATGSPKPTIVWRREDGDMIPVSGGQEGNSPCKSASHHAVVHSDTGFYTQTLALSLTVFIHLATFLLILLVAYQKTHLFLSHRELPFFFRSSCFCESISSDIAQFQTFDIFYADCSLLK